MFLFYGGIGFGWKRAKIKDVALASRYVLISSYFNIVLMKNLITIDVGITAHLPKKVCDEIRE